MFAKVKHCFPMVGHSHDDNDQYFSGIGRTRAVFGAKTMSQLVELIRRSHPNLKLTVLELDEIVDFASFIKPFMVIIHNISKPLHFTFKRVDGTVQFRTRSFRDTSWTAWTPVFKQQPPVLPELVTPSEVRDVDWGDKKTKFQKFQKYLTVDEQSEWKNWFEDMEQLQHCTSQSLSSSYVCFNDVLPICSLTSQPTPSAASRLEPYLPSHLPSLYSTQAATVQDMLRIVAPDFRLEPTNPEITASPPSQPTNCIVPATYTGKRRPKAVSEHCSLEDLMPQDMVLWMKPKEDITVDYPFWVSKVKTIDRESKQVSVVWYDRVPEKGIFLPWNQSKWQPWWNVLTEEDVQAMPTNTRQKYKEKIGLPFKQAEDTMPLNENQVFFYGFHLNKTSRRFPKSAVRRIQARLDDEQTLSANNK